MITALLFDNDKCLRGGLELLEQWRSNNKTWLWLDLENESNDLEHKILCNDFGLDEILVKEAQRKRHPPSFTDMHDYYYVLNKPLTSDSEDLDFSTQQMAMFCSDRLLITKHKQPSHYLAKLQDKLPQRADADSPHQLVAALTRRLTQRYGQILLDLEQRLDEIEDLLFDSRSDQLLKELVGYTTALRKMHRILNYHCDAYEKLSNYHRQLTGDGQYTEFDDVYALMRRYQSLCELYLSVINDLVDAYISLDSHHLNQIMKVLTIVTVVFVPLTLLVGIYGMNFEYIPELKFRYGYFILIAVMLATATGLLYLFRKVRWL